MKRKLFRPRKFKKVDLGWYFFPSIGLGISMSKWNISIELPFLVIDLSYFTEKDLRDRQRLADFFSENAELLED